MTLYDSTTASNEPDGPGDFGAGYGDGLYDNWAQVVGRFGARAVLEVCVNPADEVGNCLDVENGDARPQDAPGWTLRARARGVDPAWTYCNASTWESVIIAYLDAGVAMPLWWIADYTNSPHLPQVTVGGVTYRASACQYGGGITAPYDMSCFAPGVFEPAATDPHPPAASAPARPAEPKEKPVLIVHTIEDATRAFAVYDNHTLSAQLSPTAVAALSAAGVPVAAVTAADIEALAATFSAV